MIDRLIKRLARYILREDLKYHQELIERLKSYALLHLPEILPDGTDQTYNIQYNVDVVNSIYLKAGTYEFNNEKQ